MKIALCADGGARAGLGHLGRCAALAQAFAALGHEPVFVGVPSECRSWLSARKLKTAPLGRRAWDLVVADSYRFSAADKARLRRQARSLAVFDDDGTYGAACDWIVNAHPYASGLRFGYAKGSRRLLGTGYLPLRSEYWKAPKPRRTRARLSRLLVTLGGGDRGGLTERAVEAAAAALPDAAIVAVIGAHGTTPHRRARVRYARSPASLRPLLETSDAVVCGGGQTLYEAAFTGTPALALELGPDQRGNLTSLSKAGTLFRAGGLDARWPKRLAEALARLDASPERREAMSKAGFALLDGRGALRLARALAPEKT